MQYEFKSLKQFNVFAEKIIKNSLDEISSNVLEKLKYNVENRLYDAWTPEMYSRTGELLKSISKTKVTKVYGYYVVKIFYDTDKIHPYITDDNKWNKHADIYGENISEYIPLWIEYGTENSFYNHDGINAIHDTFEWISKEYNRMFKETLKYKGIKIE